MNKILFVFAVAAGLFLAWVDTRPHWDDMGILVMGLLLCAGLLGLLGPKLPWLWALCVGVWIPIFEIAASGKPNFGSLAALVFAFIGAYAGMLGNKIIRLAA